VCCEILPCQTGFSCIEGVCIEDICFGGAACCDEHPCQEGYYCDPATGTCEEHTPDICCNSLLRHADFKGKIIKFPPVPQTPLADMALAPVHATEALTIPNPNLLTQTTSDASGDFATDCIDLTNVALAVVMLSDDPGFDGVAGDYYPTYTIVMDVNSNEDKTCTELPLVYGVSNTLITTLSEVPALANISSDGLGIVLLKDNQGSPLEGAVLKTVDIDNNLIDLPNNAVVYPNADFTAFDGTDSSSNGIALIPGPMLLTYVIPVKEGQTWQAEPMSIVNGFCLTKELVAQ
jgi:hypothetical protein